MTGRLLQQATFARGQTEGNTPGCLCARRTGPGIPSVIELRAMSIRHHYIIMYPLCTTSTTIAHQSDDRLSAVTAAEAATRPPTPPPETIESPLCPISTLGNFESDLDGAFCSATYEAKWVPIVLSIPSPHHAKRTAAWSTFDLASNVGTFG